MGGHHQIFCSGSGWSTFPCAKDGNTFAKFIESRGCCFCLVFSACGKADGELGWLWRVLLTHQTLRGAAAHQPTRWTCFFLTLIHMGLALQRQMPWSRFQSKMWFFHSFQFQCDFAQPGSVHLCSPTRAGLQPRNDYGPVKNCPNGDWSAWTPWDLKIIWPGTWMSFSHSHAIQMILYIHIIHTYIYISVCVLYTDIHTCIMYIYIYVCVYAVYIYIWVEYGVHPSQYPSHQSKLVHFMWTNGESIILTDFNQIQSNSLPSGKLT